MDKKLPNALAEKQERQRQETANKVLHAFIELQAQGCRLSISNLMDFTGLSRSVFSKPHVRAVMAEFGYPPLKETAAESAANSPSPAQTKEQKLRTELRKRNESIRILREKNAALKEECELLRGQIFLLQMKA